jgi:hypothetical protein
VKKWGGNMENIECTLTHFKGGISDIPIGKKLFLMARCDFPLLRSQNTCIILALTATKFHGMGSLNNRHSFLESKIRRLADSIPSEGSYSSLHNSHHFTASSHGKESNLIYFLSSYKATNCIMKVLFS